MKEQLTRYRYSGPQSGVTLRRPDGTEQEYMLHDGGEVLLPAGHPWVVKAALKGLLTEVTEQLPAPEPPAEPAKPAKPGKEAQTNAG